MNDDTIKLLKECSAGCQMAIESMDQIAEFIQDDKLRAINVDYKEKHEKIEHDVADLLDEVGEEEKEPKPTASVFSWFTTEVKLMVKNDSRQVAKILMDGCNMGIQSICEYQNKYLAASREAKDAAKALVRIEENFTQDLKQFL